MRKIATIKVVQEKVLEYFLDEDYFSAEHPELKTAEEMARKDVELLLEGQITYDDLDINLLREDTSTKSVELIDVNDESEDW